MQNNQNRQTEALEALLSTIQPDQASETLRTFFIGYITTDDFCESPERDRNALVFTIGQIMAMFDSLKKV